MNWFKRVFGPRISSALVHKHDKMIARHGGDHGLSEIFQTKRAISVGEQTAVVEQLHAGVPVKDITVPRSSSSHEWFRHADLMAIKDAVGSKRMLELIKQPKGAFLPNQAINGAKELIARGKTIPGVDLAGIANQDKFPKLSQSIAQAFKEGTAEIRALATQAHAASKRTAVTSSANPTPSQPVTEGRIDIEEARRRTREVFGHAPAVIPGQNEKAQWAELTALYRQHGHSAPWDDSTAPAAIVMGVHQNDSGWQTRERRLAKAFPGVGPTTARVMEKKVEPAKPLRGRERFLASIKIK